MTKIKNLQKNWSSTLQKPRKTRKRPRTVPPTRLRTFTMKKDDIYNLILGFQYCQVGRVHSITPRYDRSHYMCTRAHMLQNCPNFVKYDFIDPQVSFPMTPRKLQSEFYNSRYGLFGGTRRVRIIARLKFAATAPRTVFSPRINRITPRCTLITCKTLKHQN